MGSLRASFRIAGRGETAARLAVVAVFLVLVARFWDPYFGVTRFLQMDGGVAAVMTPALRDKPIFVYADAGGYDGHYYGQIASDPWLRDPDVNAGMDNYPYRARRILTPLLAWCLAGGERVAAVQVYAWLNVAAWLGLAFFAWRLLPTGDWRRTVAWIGLMWSAGAMHSVRLALADLPALCWLAAGWWAWERRRLGWAAAALGAALLSRETAALALGVLVLLTWRRDGWRPAAGLGAWSVVPLGAWMAYLTVRFGNTGGGWDNVASEGIGYVLKWREVIAGWTGEAHRWLYWGTLLGLIATTVQVLRLAWLRPARPEWWLGVAYAGLAATLQIAVWEGHPGAAARVLLPLSFAFWLLVGRERVSPVWSVAGGLGVLSATVALSFVHQEKWYLATGRASEGTYLAQTTAGFYPTEHAGRNAWAWSKGNGVVRINLWPGQEGVRSAEIALTAPSPRQVEIRQGAVSLWRGEVGPRKITAPLQLNFTAGQAQLEFRSDGEPLREGGDTGRELHFAVRGVVVR
jgi:hypothetical protein